MHKKYMILDRLFRSIILNFSHVFKDFNTDFFVLSDIDMKDQENFFLTSKDLLLYIKNQKSGKYNNFI